MMVWMVWVVGAWASPGDASVREDLGVGVWVDWTRQVLAVEVAHHPQASEVQRQTELAAIVDMDAALVVGAKRVRVQGDASLEEELGDAGVAMLGRLTRRTVVEARYGREGSVGMTAELPLEVLLRPWTLERLDHHPLDGLEGGPFTGVVLDARGIRVDPAWAPRVVNASGDVLHGASWTEMNSEGSTPAVYVTDPVHPAAQRAGRAPLILQVEDAEGSDLILAQTEGECLGAAHSASSALRRGRLVIVVDP